jgi:single stranded DNA-binding protein
LIEVEIKVNRQHKREVKMNRVTIMGRIGKEPELKHTPSGMAVLSLSIATSKKTKEGEKTSWHRVKAFGKTAEVMSQYLSKGRKVLIEGEISYSEFEKDGAKRYSTDIICNQFYFVDSDNQRENKSDMKEKAYDAFDGASFAEDDIPF